MIVEHTPQLIVQENHYYPFGMNLRGIEKVGKPSHKYLYNGKEKHEEFGLNWLSYGQREYDPAIGRFNRVDRFAEKYQDFNPYNYTNNNPISRIDINGDSIWTTTDVKIQKFSNGTSFATVTETIHIRGKILDLIRSPEKSKSSDLAKNVQAKLNGLVVSSTKGSVKKVIKFDADIKGAKTMSDVKDTDHLVVMVDDVKGKADPKLGGGSSAGVGRFGWMIAYVEEGNKSWTTETVIHELGHNMNLEHTNESGNFMSYDSKRGHFSFGQLNSVVTDAKNKRLNLGQNHVHRARPATHSSSTNREAYYRSVKRGEKYPLPIGQER
ncbi:cell well associated RhsD protein, putative [Microscilla marina ATCC 23134]|uniref:Cell well associated RhsD protein, putative n=2 Tax=Microscilla marina TaxID=1027 RepID=A2A0E2_MICM2|nr:cell well associated RhsD protein, putative [Microscilla marina ATCC 23134]